MSYFCHTSKWIHIFPIYYCSLSLAPLLHVSRVSKAALYKGINRQEALRETSQNPYEQLRQLLLASRRCFSRPLPPEADSQGR